MQANQRLEDEVSKQQATEDALRSSEEALAKAQSIAQVGHWRWSIERDELISCSREYANIHGVSMDDAFILMKRQMTDVVHADDRARVESEFARFDREGCDYEIEYRIVRADGEIRYLKELGEAVQVASGQPTEQIGTVQDITRSKLKEDELREARSLAETANEAKSDFLARMSHELRTPMNAVLGFAQLLESDANMPLPEKQLGFVEHILGAGRHLLDLIDDVLDMARVESGRTQLLLESVDPVRLIEECTELIEAMATQRGITLSKHLATEPRIAIKADGTRLKQVLLNLLSNAVKYNREGGTVTLVTELVDPRMYRITISDTGLGVPAEHREKLFEPFFRLPEHSRTPGTGIGLTITRRLIELMDGRLGLDTLTGEGSTFWVELPFAEEAIDLTSCERSSESLPVYAEADPQERRYTVLYIEDEPVNLNLMREILRRHREVKLLDAPDAELGLELARTKQPDVVLLDINLPGLDGFEALQIMKSRESTRSIPVIAVSAAAMPRDIRRAREAGFFEYVTKPIAIDELTKILWLALESGSGNQSQRNQEP